MDLERDQVKLKLLDKTSDQLSGNIQILRQETKRIATLSQNLERKYREQIRSTESLLVHFELCESRASDARNKTAAEGDAPIREQNKQDHLVVQQVLRSYREWIERFNERRQRHAKAVVECKEEANAAAFSLRNAIWPAATPVEKQGSLNHRPLDVGAKVGGKEEEESRHSLNMQLMERTMEVASWKSLCETLRVDMDRLRNAMDRRNSEQELMDSMKAAQAAKEAKEWKDRCQAMQSEMWGLRDKLKIMESDLQVHSHSSARVQVLQAEVEAFRIEADTMRTTKRDMCPRSELHRTTAALEQAREEKDRLALELVQVMGERDQLKQEKERQAWASAHEGEEAIMEIQQQLDAERGRGTLLQRQSDEHKERTTAALTKIQALEADMVRRQRRYAMLETDKAQALSLADLRIDQAHGKYLGTLQKLKQRCAQRWVSISLAQALRAWREGVLHRIAMRQFERQGDQVIAEYRKCKAKRCLFAWSRSTQLRRFVRSVMKGVAIRSGLRQTYFAFFRWSRSTIAARHAEHLQRNRMQVASVTGARNTANQRRRVLAGWAHAAKRSARTRRAIERCLHPTARRLLVYGWRALVAHGELHARIEEQQRKHELVSAAMFRNQQATVARRVLQMWSAKVHLSIRVNNILEAHLLRQDTYRTHQAYATWKVLVLRRRQTRAYLNRFVGMFRRTHFRVAFHIWSFRAKHQKQWGLNKARCRLLKVGCAGPRPISHWEKCRRHGWTVLDCEKYASAHRVAEHQYFHREHRVLARALRFWHTTVRQARLRRIRLVAVLRRGYEKSVTVALLQWKAANATRKREQDRAAYQNVFAENRLISLMFRSGRKAFNKWKISYYHAKRAKQTMRESLFRKKMLVLRARTYGWHRYAKRRAFARRSLQRMRNLLLHRAWFSSFRHWLAIITQEKFEDAKCLGFSALRKSKQDMAKRLFSKARRAKITTGFESWVAWTNEHRAQEEHVSAIEAMSNWAARIASGRVLKERFQVWFAVTKVALRERHHKETSVRSILLRLIHRFTYFAFRKWDAEVRAAVRKEVHGEVGMRRELLENQIKILNDAQMTHRYKALENVSLIMADKKDRALLVRMYERWRFNVRGVLMARQREKSIMVAADALFGRNEKYLKQSVWKKWKMYVLREEQRRDVLRAIALKFHVHGPKANAFKTWQLYASQREAHRHRAQLEESHHSTIGALQAELEQQEALYMAHRARLVNSVSTLVRGWAHRDDGSTLSIFFNRWIQHVNDEKRTRQDAKSEDVEQQRGENDARGREQEEDDEYFPPPPGAPPAEKKATARGTLLIHAKRLEEENNTMSSEIVALKKEVVRLQSGGPREVPGGQSGHQSLLSLETLASSEGTFHMEQDLNDLMGENSRLQTELTATQKKLFKAKETIRIVRTGSKEKEKVSLLQETLKALEKQHAVVVAELSSTQGDLQEAYRRTEHLEKEVKRHRINAQNSQRKSEIDRKRVHQFEKRLKQETQVNETLKKTVDTLRGEAKRLLAFRKQAENEMERSSAHEETFLQSMANEQRTSAVLAQKLHLASKEVHRLLDENEHLRKTQNGGAATDSDPQDPLAATAAARPVDASGVGSAPLDPDRFGGYSTIQHTPTSASVFQNALQAQVSSVFDDLPSDDPSSMSIRRDHHGFIRTSPERDAMPQTLNDANVASDAVLGGLVHMTATDAGTVVANFRVKDEDMQVSTPRGVWR
eukprot:Stramenopile-MAST_4_protein_2049